MDVECAVVDGHVGVESTSDATSSREESSPFIPFATFIAPHFQTLRRFYVMNYQVCFFQKRFSSLFVKTISKWFYFSKTISKSFLQTRFQIIFFKNDFEIVLEKIDSQIVLEKNDFEIILFFKNDFEIEFQKNDFDRNRFSQERFQNRSLKKRFRNRS